MDAREAQQIGQAMTCFASACAEQAKKEVTEIKMIGELIIMDDRIFFPLPIPEEMPERMYPEYALEVFNLLRNEGISLAGAEAMAGETVRKKGFERMYTEET